MKKFKIFLGAILLIVILGLLTSFSVNLYVKVSTTPQIISIDKTKGADAILVLGAGVWKDKPQAVLKDRLEVAYELYILNDLPLIVSGDHGKEYYDEVNVMKNYLIEKGVDADKIFMDHAGFSTYESVYRAKEIFQVNTLIIVSQEYHLYRALYISNKLGIEAYGVSSTLRKYGNEDSQAIREYLARNKDFVKSVFKPKPTFLGEAIPVSGSGNVTND